MFKLDLKKRNWRSNCQHLLDHQKSKRVPEKIYFCFIDYTKAFDCGNHNKLSKILHRWEYQTTIPTSSEICKQTKKQQLELGMEQWTVSKLEKEHIKAVYCHLLI